MTGNDILSAVLATPEYERLVELIEKVADDAGVFGQREGAEACAGLVVATMADRIARGAELLGVDVDPATVLAVLATGGLDGAALLLDEHGYL